MDQTNQSTNHRGGLRHVQPNRGSQKGVPHISENVGQWHIFHPMGGSFALHIIKSAFYNVTWLFNS